MKISNVLSKFSLSFTKLFSARSLAKGTNVFAEVVILHTTISFQWKIFTSLTWLVFNHYLYKPMHTHIANVLFFLFWIFNALLFPLLLLYIFFLNFHYTKLKFYMSEKYLVLIDFLAAMTEHLTHGT